MKLEIKHGLLRSYTGSSTIISGPEMATTTISGPSDSIVRDDNYESLTTEVRVRHSSRSKMFESMIAGLVYRLLDEYVEKEAEKYRSIVVCIYSNTLNLSIICNSVLVACLDGGIPLKRMFYCAGDRDLFVYSNESIEMCHSLGAIEDSRIREILNEIRSVKESVEYGVRDMLAVE
jgi:hypothetical protein